MRRLSFVLLCCAVGSIAQAADRADILLIMVDDLRPMLGCYGHEQIKTPNIDRLARHGVLFQRAYCQYAKCGTSRLSMMTGLRPDAIGVFSNNKKDVDAFRRRNPEIRSLARWLKDHGYHTRSFGKIYHDGWDLANDWSAPSRPGRDREMWEVVDPDNPAEPTIIAERLSCPVMQSADVADDHLFAGRMTGEVIQALQAPTDSPRFIAVGYRRPHLPFVAPQKYYDMYEIDDSWLASNPMPNANTQFISWFNSDGYVGSAKKVGLSMPNPPNRRQAIEWNGYEMRSYLGVPNHGTIEKDLQKQLIQAYAACVSYVDAQIGRLLNELASQNRLSQTHIIFCSDHGWHLGEHSAWGKMTNYEIATRVPLIISGPQLKPSQTTSLAELVDLYPTICDLAKIAPPGHLQGESLMDSLARPHELLQETAFSQYARFGQRYMGYALRNDRYRFVRWLDEKSGRVALRECYDHRVDPEESNNLTGKLSSDLVEELENELEDALHR